MFQILKTFITPKNEKVTGNEGLQGDGKEDANLRTTRGWNTVIRVQN
jgi:hypothetical protein